MNLLIEDKERGLVKRLRNGDNGAMYDFYSLYAGYLTAVCSRYIADEEDLKDVLQDALVCIFTHIGDFEYRGAGSLKAWSVRIAVNQSLKFLRAKKQHEFARLEWDIADEPEEDDPPVGDIPPEAIHRLVSELPTGYRTVFNLFVFENKSHHEIASLLGIKADTSASQLHRAKNLLAKKIRQYNNSKQPPR